MEKCVCLFVVAVVFNHRIVQVIKQKWKGMLKQCTCREIKLDPLHKHNQNFGEIIEVLSETLGSHSMKFRVKGQFMKHVYIWPSRRAYQLLLSWPWFAVSCSQWRWLEPGRACGFVEICRIRVQEESTSQQAYMRWLISFML